MKKWIIRLIVVCIYCQLSPSTVGAQSHELQQLILNVQKLNQLKAILEQLQAGYEIVSKGYQTIKDLSESNFKIHETFLDGLLQVSPTVRRYKKVADILALQQQLMKQYRNAWRKFANDKTFSLGEINYIEKVFIDLVERSNKNLEELILIITAGELRMNDSERLTAIDRIHFDMKEKLSFLQHFNQKAELLSAQRKKELNDNRILDKLYK